MNLRQAVVFAITMSHEEGVLSKHPSYVFEKLESCEKSCVPERFLDTPSFSIFRAYAERWKMDWKSGRDYWNVPMDQFDEKTGEPKKEFLEKLEESGGGEKK